MLKKFFIKDSYVKNISNLIKGTILAQIIIVAISPILTRIYTPEVLGAFTVILTIIGLFSPVINGRYDISIVSAKRNEDINPLIVGALIISLVLSTLIFIGILIISELFPNLFSDLQYWIVIIPLILMMAGVINVLTAINNRDKDYKLIATVSVQRSLVQSSLQVLFGVLKFGVIGLMITNLFSLLVGVIKQYKSIELKVAELLVVKAKDIRSSLHCYKNQVLFSTPAIIMNSLSYSIIIFLVSYLYGAIEVGYYSISVRMLGLPLVLISANISRVFLEKAVKENEEKGNFYNIFKRTTILLVISSSIFFSILMVISVDLFELVFGQGWGRAGLYVVIMSPMFAVRFVVSALSISLVIVKKQRVELFLQLGFLLSALIVTLIVLLYSVSIEVFLCLISIFYSVNYICVFVILFKSSKK